MENLFINTFAIRTSGFAGRTNAESISVIKRSFEWHQNKDKWFR